MHSSKKEVQQEMSLRERQKSTMGGLVIKSKLILLTARQANTLRSELLGQRIATLFRKLGDQENDRLVSQRAQLEVRLLPH